MKTILIGLFLASSFSASAQEEPRANLNISGHQKTALIPTERHKQGWYDSQFHFSPGVRAGDFIFISGVVAGAFGTDKPIGKEEFQIGLRRAFNNIQDVLKAGGADMNNVVKIRTFHVFNSPYITINKHDQVAAVAEVKGEFIQEPHPAWTAVGTTELFPDKGLVEIEVVVYAPENTNQ